MTINERITYLIANSGLSPSEFAEAIEVQRSSISHITSGRNKPSLDFLIKIKERFPEIEWDWLITGNGNMKNQNNLFENKLKTNDSKVATLPDLFTLIENDNIAKIESVDRVENKSNQNTASDSPNSIDTSFEKQIIESQRIEKEATLQNNQSIENKEVKVSKIVFFYNNGTFELYEPK